MEITRYHLFFSSCTLASLYSLCCNAIMLCAYKIIYLVDLSILLLHSSILLNPGPLPDLVASVEIRKNHILWVR